MRRLALVAVVLLMALAGCTSAVAKPKADSTPPTLSWHVVDEASKVSMDFTKDGQIAGKQHDVFQVSLTADDPQGIHHITLGGQYTRACIEEDIGMGGGGVVTGQDKTLSPDGNNYVKTSVTLSQPINPDIGCPIGFDFRATTITLVGTGTNYFDGTSQISLMISVRP